MKGMDKMQSKREKQYKDSAQLSFSSDKNKILFYSFTMIGAVLIAVVMTGGSHKNTEEVIPTEMADTNHTLYNEGGKEDIDWTGTTQDIDNTYPDEHVMWISGEGDTIWE